MAMSADDVELFPDNDPLWVELFGPGEVDLETELNRVLEQNRQGRKAIARALRVLHDAVGAASVPPIDTAVIDSAPLIDGDTGIAPLTSLVDIAPPTDGEKLAAVIAAIGVAIDALDPYGEGVDEPMSDSD